jgi:membrane protein DedA with SNARE-associated domain
MRRRRRLLLYAGVGVLILICLAVALQIVDSGDSLGLLTTETASGWSYVVIFALIVADAMVPVFPSESALNTASTMAAAGVLDLSLVVLAGALGAVVGDSALYWIARVAAGSRVQAKLDQAERKGKVAEGLELMGRSAPVLIVAGRFVPGLRFVVNASMGLALYPYRRFLLWSSIGGVAWSLYTCVLAYWIGIALADFPLASIVISGAITTAILFVIFVFARRQKRAAERPAEAVAEPARS